MTPLAATLSASPIWYVLVGGVGAWVFLAYVGCHFKRNLLILRILETSRIKAQYRYEEIRDYLHKRLEVQMGLGIDSDRAARILETMAGTSNAPASPAGPENASPDEAAA